MLDLDSLAEKCASLLGQSEDLWRMILWSPDFQKISTSMSDGEIEALVVHCGSVAHVAKVLRFLTSHPEAEKVSPYTLLNREAAKAGVSLKDWIGAMPSSADL